MFAVEQTNVGVVKLIARSIEVWHVGQENCFAREKRTHRGARSLLGNAPDVPDGEGSDGDGDCETYSSSHEKRSVTLRAWVKLSMYGFQPLLIDVCIHLRCRDIRVSEHFLDYAQVGAISEQVGRETVPEKMWINIFF